MAPIQDFEVEDGINHLRNSRATGLDIWAPLEWKRLPSPAKAELVDNFRAAEAAVVPPLQALYQLMVMMLKPTGGERTIALQTLWHFLWSGIRGQRIKDYDGEQARFWDSAIEEPQHLVLVFFVGFWMRSRSSTGWSLSPCSGTWRSSTIPFPS